MDLSRINQLRAALEDENISLSELSEIDEAFDELVESGAVLRDEAEAATASDKLDELEAAVTPLEQAIYDYVVENYGESEAQDPSYNLSLLADHINKLEIIKGAGNGTIGDLLR